MKRILALLISLLMLCTLVACSGDEESNITPSNGDIAVIEVEDYGTIKVELYPDIAPVTVANFKKLVNEGFYNGLTFHRIIKGFMIQCGDPNGDGTGGSDETIYGEFSANGFANSLSHKRGVISMGRKGNDYDSASSHFFICHADSIYLDGQYAAFGEVIEGIEVVDAIASVSTDGNDKPFTDVIVKSIHLEEKPAGSEEEVKEEEPVDFGEPVKAEIEIEGYGVISLDLYPEIAPITVENFVNLAKSGFYDGVKIHRVSPGFVIQGGDPTGTGMGGAENDITGEFAANGIENPISHQKGVISMARASYSYNSASSQFFICLKDVSSMLDSQYAAFGQVTEGLEIVEALGEVELLPSSETPAEDIIIKTVRILDTETTEETSAIESDILIPETTDPAVNEKLNSETKA